MTVDASLLHPTSGQCPPLLWRQLATFSTAPVRGRAATDTYRNARWRMSVFRLVMVARMPRDQAHLRIAITTSASAAVWTGSSVDADGRAATAVADESYPCNAGQPAASAIDDCPAPAATMQSPCIRTDAPPPAPQRRIVTGTRFMPPLYAYQLPLRACAPFNLFTAPFAERALGP